MIHTKNFHPESDKKLICTCNHILCDNRSVSQFVLNKIQLIREDLNQPLSITSGGRCQYHPSELHRITPADHQLCQAVDVAVNGGVMRAKLVKLGLTYGFNAIGVAKTFVHLGFREDCKLTMWVY
jgi:hypothetical protein